MFGQRLAGRSAARITWALRTVAAILANPGTPSGRCGTGSAPTAT
jgi:hypothetical protein